MIANIVKKTKDILIIQWHSDSKGFGELTMTWDKEKDVFILDSEMMGIDTVLKIFKSY